MEYSENEDQADGMGTTVVAAVISAEKAFVCWVGDSRLYRFRNQRLQLMTRDHSLVNELIESGEISEQSAFSDHRKHIVTQALGSDDIKISTLNFKVKPSDIILLCSDGLSDMLPDNTIETGLQEPDIPLPALAQLLLNQALSAGGLDNISIGLIKIQPK